MNKRLAIGHLASAGAYVIFGINVVVCRDIATDGGIAPIVLLYSYTRIPRNKLLSLAIPVIAFALMLLIFLEGIHQGLGLYSNSINKVSLQELLDTVNMTVMK